MSSTGAAKAMFEQQAQQQADSPARNAPKGVRTTNGKVGWNDGNNQSKKRLNFGGQKTVTYDNLPAKKSLADLP